MTTTTAEGNAAQLDAKTILDSARAELNNGDAQTAFATLRGLLAYPARLLQRDAGSAEGSTVSAGSAAAGGFDRVLLVPALAALADAALPIAGDAFAAKLSEAARAIDEPDALYDAAYVLYEERQFSVAATLLAHANRVAPGSPKIVAELGSNLEALMRHADASAVLEASGLVGQDGFASYLAIYYDVMCGNIARAKTRLPMLADAPGEVAQMCARVRGMIDRADALAAANVSTSDRALTAWHAAINGTLLLHESPHGYDTPMHGRYAYVSDSPGLMREGLDRLRAVLRASGVKVTRVIAAPERGSRILARAAAKLLELPFEAWSVAAHAGGSGENALVVVWDLRTVEDDAFLKAMHHHAPGRVLFAHASCWTEPFAYAPDVTTYLHQVVTHPYLGGALRVNPETKQTEREPPDAREEDVLAAEILAAGHSDPSETPVDLPIAVMAALASLPEETRPGILRGHGTRLRERAGSPVSSARFA